MALRTSPLLPTIAVVGAGAIGTVVADALSHAAQVTLCRRGTTAPMTLETPTGVHRVDARVVRSPAGLAPVDWVIVATKAQDTEGAAEWFDQLVGQHTRVAVLQNGIEHEARVARWVSRERVVPVSVYIAAERIGPDAVACRQITGLTAPATAIARDFAALFPGTVPVTLAEDFVTRAWSKLVLNAALNPITTLTDRTAEVASQPAMRPLVLAIIQEAVAVATAAGAVMDSSEIPRALARMDSLPAQSATSMQLDRRNSRPLEHEYLTGAIIRAADQHSIDVPTIRTIHALISAISGGASEQAAAA